MKTYSQQDIELALQNCEAEPIHQIGQIQPHGVLLVLSDSSPRIILQSSANFSHFLGLSTESVQNLLLEDVLGRPSTLVIEQLIFEINENQAATYRLSMTINEHLRELQVRLFMSANVYVLELMDEDVLKSQDRLPEFLKLISKGFSNFEQNIDIYDYLEKIAVLVRDLTGFDRVMVYRFDANWDGEVIAESRVEEAESYLGLHFPASDIPPQARHLYTVNYIRHIADISAEPVPVLPALNPLTGQPLDMSFSSLRSFSPVHREYLGNMGVRASMSVSLLQNGQLWGLIACHHLTPKRVSNALEEAAALIGRMTSVKLFAIEADGQRKLIDKSSRIVGKLLKHITSNDLEVVISMLLMEILDLLKATGVMMKIDGRLFTLGGVPNANITDDLFTWLSTKNPETGVFSLDQLSQEFTLADSAVVAGLLVAPVSKDMRNFIAWFREEKPRTVKWAGNTQKNITKDSLGIIHLNPRKSFEVWTETWRGRSEPWTQNEKEAAAMLALVLTEALLQKKHLDMALTKQRSTDAELAEYLLENDRRKNEFLAMLGHELRNPLTPISNIAQLLSSQAFTEKEQIVKVAEILNRNVTHITQLVDDLLDVSRITQGHIKLTQGHVELVKLLKDSLESIHYLIQSKQQTLNVYFPPQPIYVDGDSIRITQVFSNLLTNAAKYTKNGGRIDLIVDVEGPFAIVRVQDNGIGIEPNLLPHIFELFIQGQRGLDRSEEGLGLGLALVKKLVDLHGGQVTAYSQGINQGSEFVVKLPRVLEASIPTESEDSPGLNKATGEGLLVLMIDDNEGVVDSISLWLEMLGYQVETASNGMEGISVAQRFFPDIILLDIGLPDMDGYQVAKKLREQLTGKRPLIIAMSGYALSMNNPCLEEAGFDHYVVKPPKLSELRQLITEYQLSQ